MWKTIGAVILLGGAAFMLMCPLPLAGEVEWALISRSEMARIRAGATCYVDGVGGDCEGAPGTCNEAFPRCYEDEGDGKMHCVNENEWRYIPGTWEEEWPEAEEVEYDPDGRIGKEEFRFPCWYEEKCDEICDYDEQEKVYYCVGSWSRYGTTYDASKPDTGTVHCTPPS